MFYLNFLKKALNENVTSVSYIYYKTFVVFLIFDCAIDSKVKQTKHYVKVIINI